MLLDVGRGQFRHWSRGWCEEYEGDRRCTRGTDRPLSVDKVRSFLQTRQMMILGSITDRKSFEGYVRLISLLIFVLRF